MNDEIEKLKRGRGRPRLYNTSLDKIVRGKGRPKGSKNKPKHSVSITNNVNSNELVITSIDTVEKEGGIGTKGSEGAGKFTKHPKNVQLKNKNPDFDDNSSNTDIHINKQEASSISNIKVTPELIIAARRQLALNSLKDYACMIDIPDAPLVDEDQEDAFSTIRLDTLAVHHELMCNELERLVTTSHKNREYDNIMFFMPPGSAKSTYVDVIFGSWYLAKFKRKQIILASYGDEPALNQARKTKALVNSKDYQSLFPDVRLSKDRTAVDNWALSNGSSFLSRSLSGEITGRRSDLGIVDDPVKGAEEADSENSQKKTWQAYLKNFCTRLKPGAPIVLIMTRWNENDLAGQILPDGWDGESGDFLGKDDRRWRVICLPAICNRDDDPLGRKIGESLWPEWFGKATGDPLDHWKPFRKDARTWSSLYQQKPTEADGIYFERSNFEPRYNKRELDRFKDTIRYYGTSDYAVTEGKGDNTVLRIWAIDDSVEPSQIYLVDGYKAKSKSNKWIKAQCDLMFKYKPFKWFGEAGAIQKAVEPMLLEAMRTYKPRRIMCQIEWLTSSQSKEIRARGAQSLAQEKRVHIPDDPEYDDVIDEYVKFPTGKHDDDVDNLSLIGRVIDKITIKRFKPSSAKKVARTITPFNRKSA